MLRTRPSLLERERDRHTAELKEREAQERSRVSGRERLYQHHNREWDATVPETPRGTRHPRRKADTSSRIPSQAQGNILVQDKPDPAALKLANKVSQANALEQIKLIKQFLADDATMI